MEPGSHDNREYALGIDVQTTYLDDQSEPGRDRIAAQLLGRHWVITDANGKVEEVEGEGVVGEQPWLRPGDDFTYTSGAVLETQQGTMHGNYAMVADDGTRFEAPIPAFTLSVPRTLH